MKKADSLKLPTFFNARIESFQSSPVYEADPADKKANEYANEQQHP
jgi:hypothetical protein